MQKEVKIVSAEVAAHAHATEDLEKVKRAMLNVLPEDLRAKLKSRIDVQKLEGHHGNPIHRLTLRLSGEEASSLLRFIISGLSEGERTLMELIVKNRYDKKRGRLFLRLSKQDAYLGRIRLLEGDDVLRVTVTFRGSPSPTLVASLLKEMGSTK